MQSIFESSRWGARPSALEECGYAIYVSMVNRELLTKSRRPADPLLRWLLQPPKNDPWNGLQEPWPLSAPWLDTQAERDLIAAAARTPLPGVNPPWDVKTGRIRTQPPRRRPRPGSRAAQAELQARIAQ